MVRAARQVFQELGIPESDPAWDHIRNSAETNLRKPQASTFDSVGGLISEGSTKLEAPKRGVSSQEVREKKAKQKQKLSSRAEIMVKDESLKINSRLSQAGIRDGETVQMKGMQGTSRESLTTGRIQGGSSSSQKSAKYGLKRGDGGIPQTASTKPQNVRQDDESSLVGKLPASDREGMNLSPEVVRRRRDKGPEPSDSEREGRHLQSDLDKARVGREEGTRVDHRYSLSKRKTANRDDSEYLDVKSLLQKRRKTESSLLPRDEKPMGSLTHNKSNVEQRTHVNTTTKDLATTKIRKDSPSGPSKHGNSKAKISSNIVSSYPPPSNDEGPRIRHGSTKNRRRSPIYTSSEEELPVSDRVSSHSSSLTTPSTLAPSNHGSRTASRSVTTNHTALRERYSTAYVEYLTSLQKLVMQRRIVDQMLRTSDSGSVTDSDSEVGLLHPEELARLAADHRKRHEELASIQQMFSTSTSSSR